MKQPTIKGGKSNGLEALVKNTNFGYKFPGYDTIDVSYYSYIERQFYMADIASAINALKDPEKKVTPFAAFRLPKEIENQIYILANKYKGKDVIVRSDSFREDTEHSFAGIYESIIVEKVTKRKLIDAVTNVYESLNSEKAQRYRAEHDIKYDKMGIIIQEFIDPDLSGFMYTSNPSFPLDLVLEFYFGSINENLDYEPYIFDYEKKNGEKVFESENWKSKRREFETKKEIEFNELMKKLVNVGINLEKKLGPSDIEFLIKNKDIYLVQRREITDLEEPAKVTIPQYEEEQFLGSTKVMRGRGKITLPVVWVGDFTDMLDKSSIISRIDRTKSREIVEDFFEDMVFQDNKFKEGYILLTPHFHETGIKRVYLLSSNIPPDVTMDKLTPHKKGVITVDHDSICSHAMTVAREKGIVYAGFYKIGKFMGVYTGDIISIYFKGREALVYKEKTPLKSMKETHPKASIKIKKHKGNISFETPDYSYLDSHKVIVNDFEYFLNQNTGDEWKHTTIQDDMGAVFTNSKGNSIYLGIAAQHGSSYFWYLIHYSHIIGFKKPLPKNEFDTILKAYVNHLKK